MTSRESGRAAATRGFPFTLITLTKPAPLVRKRAFIFSLFCETQALERKEKKESGPPVPAVSPFPLIESLRKVFCFFGTNSQIFSRLFCFSFFRNPFERNHNDFCPVRPKHPVAGTQKIPKDEGRETPRVLGPCPPNPSSLSLCFSSLRAPRPFLLLFVFLPTLYLLSDP